MIGQDIGDLPSFTVRGDIDSRRLPGQHSSTHRGHIVHIGRQGGLRRHNQHPILIRIVAGPAVAFPGVIPLDDDQLPQAVPVQISQDIAFVIGAVDKLGGLCRPKGIDGQHIDPVGQLPADHHLQDSVPVQIPVSNGADVIALSLDAVGNLVSSIAAHPENIDFQRLGVVRGIAAEKRHRSLFFPIAVQIQQLNRRSITASQRRGLLRIQAALHLLNRGVQVFILLWQLGLHKQILRRPKQRDAAAG